MNNDVKVKESVVVALDLEGNEERIREKVEQIKKTIQEFNGRVIRERAFKRGYFIELGFVDGSEKAWKKSMGL